MMIKRLNCMLNYKSLPTQKILMLELMKQLNKSGCIPFNIKSTQHSNFNLSQNTLALQSGQDTVDQAMRGF